MLQIVVVVMLWVGVFRAIYVLLHVQYCYVVFMPGLLLDG